MESGLQQETTSTTKENADVPTETDLKAAVGTKDQIITQWGKVRQQTWNYLDSLSNEDLAGIPDHMKGKQHEDPIREFFAMTIGGSLLTSHACQQVPRVVAVDKIKGQTKPSTATE